MRKLFYLMFMFFVIISTTTNVEASADKGNERQKAIILFHSAVDKEIIEKLGGELLYTFQTIPAASISLPKHSITLSAKSAEIESMTFEKEIAVASQIEDWGYKQVKANTFKESGLTGKGSKIAIIDTGIDLKHRDLHVSGGESFVDYTTSFTDDNGHGTHVAGIISAKNNNYGIVGVAPEASIYSLKAFDKEGIGSTTSLAEALDWAIKHQMNVINLSFEYHDYDPVVEALLKKANEKNMLIVAAAGNTGTSEVQYPAKHESVIAVGAVDQNLKKASFSSSGKELDVVSPGTNILSTWQGNLYKNMSGTSMASPFVTGYLAVFREKFPEKTSSELRDMLQKNAIDLGKPGKDDSFGYGLISPIFETPDDYGDFFKVTSENATIYMKHNDKLVEAGTLLNGQTYKRIRDYGNWHEIQYGDSLAYLHKNHTEPISSPAFSHPISGPMQEKAFFMTKQDANVYDNSSGSLVKIGTIKKDKQYAIYADYGNWVIVNLSGRKGYVHKSNLTILSDTTTYKTTTKAAIYVKEEGMLVKKGTIEANQPFTQARNYGDWHEISFGHTKGYIYKKWTKPIETNEPKNATSSTIKFQATQPLNVYVKKDGKLEKFVELNEGATYPIVGDYGDWAKISIAGRLGFIYKENVWFVFHQSSKQFTAYTNNLSIYRKQNGKLLKIGSLTKGQSYQRVSDYGNWHRIFLDHDFGYVYKKGTMPAAKDIVSNHPKSRITFTVETPVNVYDNSTNKLIPFAALEKGISYSAIAWYGDWLRISLSGREGYVHKNAVSMN